ncbi:MAG: synthase subunit epsilon [Hydrocarboniphaga sp.]|uniref:F0F1 ATP synthase subunit epsilon n=1 Tax=Hydrocarboniphaga sp. TaxID=2033016 RepID=UPI00261B85F0|nr:F0F1 ATP synthase subunit epsilon [Hydrocarboniphaga sp.]MDB5973026.1 synthase subunit epsilon [Hydrocarboniphaga sp.]
MAQIHVDIVSAEGQIHEGEASMVFAPAEMGEVGIAPRHSPLLTRLKPGAVRVRTPSGEELQFFVSGGILEIQPHLVTILADTALRAKDADEASALKAKQDAESKLAGAKTEMDLAKAQQEMIEAAARLEFVRKLNAPGHH